MSYDNYEPTLTTEQVARIEALNAARNLIKTVEGLMKVKSPETYDLIYLAQYILEGEDDGEEEDGSDGEIRPAGYRPIGYTDVTQAPLL